MTNEQRRLWSPWEWECAATHAVDPSEAEGMKFIAAELRFHDAASIAALYPEEMPPGVSDPELLARGQEMLNRAHFSTWETES
jgi:hypothetical protein